MVTMPYEMDVMHGYSIFRILNSEYRKEASVLFADGNMFIKKMEEIVSGLNAVGLTAGERKLVGSLRCHLSRMKSEGVEGHNVIFDRDWQYLDHEFEKRMLR